MIAKLTEARWLCETLGEIFCLTFVRGVDTTEALRRMGGYPDTVTELGPEEIFERQNSYLAGYPRIAGAVELDGWTVVLEPNGFAGVGTLLAAVSQGTEAVAVLRHDYAHPRFAYAVDGTVLTAFDPGRIDEVTGTGTGRLGAHLEQVRRAPVDQSPDGGGAAREATRAVVLAGLVTGVRPTTNALSSPMLTAQFEPWFTDAAPEGGGLSMSVVFTGANAPTTIDTFPRGEAVHYREHALTLGVPDSAILIETTARNTGENITRTRDLLTAHGITPGSVTLISRPYQQRRAYATCRRLWPEVHVRCASLPMPLDDYVASIGDAGRFISMLVGDTQRIWLYADRGHAIPQPVPDNVRDAYRELTEAGYTSRIIT